MGLPPQTPPDERFEDLGSLSADFGRRREDLVQEKLEDIERRDDAHDFAAANDGQMVQVALAKNRQHFVGC